MTQSPTNRTMTEHSSLPFNVLGASRFRLFLFFSDKTVLTLWFAVFYPGHRADSDSVLRNCIGP